MKIVLLVAGSAVALIVLAVVVVVGIGAMLPKRHVVSRSAVYKAGAEQLYALIAGTQDWRPDVVRSEVFHDAEGRELLRETSRRGQTMTYEVLDPMPPRSLTRRIAEKNLPFSGRWTYALEPGGNGTVVRITEEGEVYNPVFRFMSRYVLGQTSTIDAYLQALGKVTGQAVVIGD